MTTERVKPSVQYWMGPLSWLQAPGEYGVRTLGDLGVLQGTLEEKDGLGISRCFESMVGLPVLSACPARLCRLCPGENRPPLITQLWSPSPPLGCRPLACFARCAVLHMLLFWLLVSLSRLWGLLHASRISAEYETIVTLHVASSLSCPEELQSSRGSRWDVGGRIYAMYVGSVRLSS